MTDRCHKIGCGKLGSKRCSACKEACYCSVECQTEDWKVHKRSCININKLPLTPLSSLSEIDKYCAKVSPEVIMLKSVGKYREGINLIKKFPVFVEHQIGVQQQGSPYFRRRDGLVVDNEIVISIRIEATKLHLHLNDLHSQLEYATETRRMADVRDKSVDANLQLCSDAERNLAAIHIQNRSPVEIEYHCKQCLKFARLRREGGEEKVIGELLALRIFIECRGLQNRIKDAVILCEENYLLVSMAFRLEHSRVHEASQVLIDLLIANNEYSRAEDYVRVIYGNLIDPANKVNQEGREVAHIMYCLAHIWLRATSSDERKNTVALAEEAEQMQIMEARNSPPREMGNYCANLGDVLLIRKKYTNETLTVLERSLALSRLQSAVYMASLSASLRRLKHFHGHIGGSLPYGPEQDRMFELRDRYQNEINTFPREFQY